MHRSARAVVVCALAGILCGCAQQTPTSSIRRASDSVAAASTFQARLHDVLHRRDSTGVIVGARVVDLTTGQELYTDNPDTPMLPASNLKLVTTAATLDCFGPAHTFDTYLAKDGDDLWLIGTGDPSLGDPKIAKARNELPTTVLRNWAEQLKAKGLTHFNHLYYYDGAFESLTVHPSWSRGFLTDWYAAPVTGLNFNDNCIDVTVTPTSPGQPVKYSVMPPLTHLSITNHMLTGAKEVEEPVDRSDDSMNWTLAGGVSAEKKLGAKCVPHPGEFFADALRTAFEADGITFSASTEHAGQPLGGHLVPPQDKTLLVQRTPLPVALNRLNKDSQNLFAEAFCKMLGRQWDLDHGQDRPGSWASGTAAEHAFLQKNHIDDSHVILVDGSGLSRQNRVTARALSDLLVTMYHHPASQVFFDSLPVGGWDGTIGKRQKDIAGRIHAKTGYIGGVRSLSGYALPPSGHPLAFSLLFNRIPGSVKPYEDLQDDACRLLANYPAVDKVELPPTTQP